MIKRRSETQVFSVSFLDVLSCALGGVLLLLLMIIQSNRERIEAYKKSLKSKDQQIEEAQQAIDEARGALESARGEAESLARANEALEKAQQALVGLKGDMKGIVFIFDTSGSMKTPRFPEYTGLLKNWIENLEFDRLNVVRFSSDVTVWKAGTMPAASKANRAEASRFVDTFVPDGGTNTLGALQAGLALPGVDTVVLFSDGAPAQPPATILAWLRSNAGPGVVINTVALGDYFQKEYGVFLQQVANQHNGMFIGR